MMAALVAVLLGDLAPAVIEAPVLVDITNGLDGSLLSSENGGEEKNQNED